MLEMRKWQARSQRAKSAERGTVRAAVRGINDGLVTIMRA